MALSEDHRTFSGPTSAYLLTWKPVHPPNPTVILFPVGVKKAAILTLVGHNRLQTCLCASIRTLFVLLKWDDKKNQVRGSLICPSLVLLIHPVWPLGRPQNDLETTEFHKNSILNTYNTPFLEYFSSLESKWKNINWNYLRTTTKLQTQKATKHVG